MVTIKKANIKYPERLGTAKVTVLMSDGREITLFHFYSDEIDVEADVLKGMTIQEAFEYKRKLDKAYLQS